MTVKELNTRKVKSWNSCNMESVERWDTEAEMTAV